MSFLDNLHSFETTEVHRISIGWLEHFENDQKKFFFKTALEISSKIEFFSQFA